MTSRSVSKFLGGAWVCLLALSGLFAGCQEQAAGGDSETHFLEKCTDSCSGGLSCLCGVCTKVCTEQASCGELSPSASCDGSCADSSSKLCDVACSRDADCSSLGADFACAGGHCRQSSPSAAGGASGSGGAGEASAAGARAADAGAAGAASLSACQVQPDLTPSFPAPAALDPDLVARAATVIGSCMPDDGVARNAAHLWLEHLAAPRFYFRLGEQLACFANAGCGCAAVKQCLSFSYARAPAVCPSGCQGDAFTGCGDGVQVSMDCSRFGLSCDPAAGCVADVATACDGTETATCTAQGEVLFCGKGFMQKTPCQALGFSCVAGQCQGEGAACTADSFTELEEVAPVGSGCTGDTLEACLGGHSTTIDCTTQGPGFSCQARAGTFFCGLAAECLPAGNYSSPEAATCDGTTLSFCNAGRLEHLDCTKLGFSGCDFDSALGHYGCTPGIGEQ